MSAQDFYEKSKVVSQLKANLKNPEGYYNEQKATIERMKSLEDQLKASIQKNNEFSAELTNKTKAIEELKQENEQIVSASGIAFVKNANSSNSFSVGGSNNSNTPTIAVVSPYRVQVGIFTNYNMNGYLQMPKPFYSSNVNGRNVMEIGGFNSADDAYAFSQELRKLGLSGAFVTKYNGNQRDMSYNYLTNGGNGSYRSASQTPAPIQSGSTPAAYNRYGSSSSSGSVNSYNNSTTVTPATSSPKKSFTMQLEDDSTPSNVTTPANSTPKPSEQKRSSTLVIED